MSLINAVYMYLESISGTPQGTCTTVREQLLNNVLIYQK
jgi:hypothetical protein